MLNPVASVSVDAFSLVFQVAVALHSKVATLLHHRSEAHCSSIALGSEFVELFDVQAPRFEAVLRPTVVTQFRLLLEADPASIELESRFVDSSGVRCCSCLPQH